MNAPIHASIRNRLLLGLTAVTISYSAILGWWTLRDSVSEIYELFDVHLAQTALAILHVSDPDEGDSASIPNLSESPDLHEIFSRWAELPERLGKSHLSPSARNSTDHAPSSSFDLHSQYERSLRYQVWSPDHLLLLKSSNAPSEVMALSDGFSESTDAQGMVWRHYAVWDRHHDLRVLVSENHALRNRMVRSIALHAVSPLVLGLPVLLALLWLSIRRGLRPLALLARDIGDRKPDNLAALDVESAPHEVRPMVAALNQLLSRMEYSLEGERRFNDHAAHELRTPLAVIQAQLFVARNAAHDAEREAAMDQLQSGVSRAIRLVGQMLAMARIDPEQALSGTALVQMGALLEAACAGLAPLALQKGLVLELKVPPDLPPVSGNPDMLSILVCNLLDNAIRYTQSGGQICAEVGVQAADLVVQVHDNGPGIPTELRERAFEQFFRLPGQDQPGTGLGLAICRRIAALHGASVSLSAGPDGCGTTASFRMPLAP